MLSIKDKQIAMGSSYIDLSFINLSVPLGGFFIFAVVVAIALFINLMLYYNKLRSLVGALMDYDKEGCINYDKNKLFPWGLNTYGVSEGGIYGALQSLFSGITLWFTLPTALFILSFVYVKKHDELLSYLIVGSAFASVLLVFLFWNRFNKPKETDDVWDLVVLFTIVTVFTAGWYASCIMVPEINAGKYAWANLNLKNEILSVAPVASSKNDQYYWLDLEGANLNGADLRNTVIQQSNLSGTKLDNAILINSDLSNSNLSGVSLCEYRPQAEQLEGG